MRKCATDRSIPSRSHMLATASWILVTAVQVVSILKAHMKIQPRIGGPSHAKILRVNRMMIVLKGQWKNVKQSNMILPDLTVVTAWSKL
jgi:hypothetical protein